MEHLFFDNDNKEGKYPTAFVAEGIELKKGEKAVATDLVDFYDVEIDDNTLSDGQALIYNSSKQKWVNGDAGGGLGCNVFTGYNTSEYTNAIVIPEHFNTLSECFNFLRGNCFVIPAQINITIHILKDIVDEEVSLNHVMGHRIILDFHNNWINFSTLSITDGFHIKMIQNAQVKKYGETFIIKNNSSCSMFNIKKFIVPDEDYNDMIIMNNSSVCAKKILLEYETYNLSQVNAIT